MEVNKNSVTIRISNEMAFWMQAQVDPRYARRIEREDVTQPTDEEWEDYRNARDALARLRESPYFEDGGPDYSAAVREPEPRREYVYAETNEEWLARCWAMVEADSK